MLKDCNSLFLTIIPLRIVAKEILLSILPKASVNSFNS